jgi:alpha-beta hydrolase superfamily lysophospholipase
MSFDERFRLASPTGADLNVYRTTIDDPLAVVQVNHGLAEHAGRYARFARHLAGQGIATFAHDHRGHGATTAPGAPPGSFGPGRAADLVLRDVDVVHDHITTEHPDVPIIVFGHSMGALIALSVLFRRRQAVSGAAIWNGNFSAGLLGRAAQAILAWERFRLGSDAPSRVLPRLTFRAWARQVSDGRTPFDWLSRDHAEVDAYMADPLCGFDASVGMWQAVFDLVFAGSNDANLAGVPRDLPFHLVGGGGDPESEFGKTVTALAERLRRQGISNVRSTIYPGMRHESLNETNREEVMAQFGAWAEEVAIGAGTTRPR